MKTFFLGEDTETKEKALSAEYEGEKGAAKAKEIIDTHKEGEVGRFMAREAAKEAAEFTVGEKGMALREAKEKETLKAIPEKDTVAYYIEKKVASLLGLRSEDSLESMRAMKTLRKEAGETSAVDEFSSSPLTSGTSKLLINAITSLRDAIFDMRPEAERLKTKAGGAKPAGVPGVPAPEAGAPVARPMRPMAGAPR